MENQNDEKVKCPFCGYEMEKGAKRCENCASVIEKDINSDNSEERPENAGKSETIIRNAESGSTEQTVNKSNKGEEVGKPQQNYIPYENAYNMNKPAPQAKKQLTNGLKVGLTALCVIVPILGQFLGLVLSIIFMNSDDDMKDCDDRRSFGLCLLITCVVAFVISVFWGFVFLILLTKTF